MRRQQRAFDQFRQEYNYQRPHQALDLKTPSDYYQPSCRTYPNRVSSPDYKAGLVVRGVGDCGRIRWSGERIFITKTLAHEPIGLEGVADGIWKLWFANYPIGWMDERTLHATDLDNPPQLPQNQKSQQQQNLPQKEKPVYDSDNPQTS